MLNINNNKVNLVLTMGDAAGIGPEVILKALADSSITEDANITIIGDRPWLEHTYHSFSHVTNLAHPDNFDIIDVSYPLQGSWGEGNAQTGEASFLYLEKAIQLTLEGKFEGIVTAPIAKYLWQKAGYDYPGQTEVLALKSHTDKFGMMFVGKSPRTGWILKTLLATTHIPLNQVSSTLNAELMTLKLELLLDTLKKDFNLDTPIIAIAGLNPHSGEDGKLGTEEKEWLQDWFNDAQKNYAPAKLMGLLPPDTMWVKPFQAWYNNGYISVADAFLALYHDQGLIPVKAMAFDQAINTTIGLPFIRTSPDHGTAFDIAGKGIANPESMKSAIKLAITLCKNRRR
ncbi:4-hydroxythreonine-4-phosphate dehydrogenase PdxA [Cyanobacterium sp. IPPAS B-1200]|uniref:4-hydroxythreonine-4-phosphate dehydrogenase PdxA n=1 Tax=Cyanobacterium sp. IPPAS B-1200 TaxID=1562720 RepID=UPI0009020739|nr:4-hydroxythreonine-4-phosphate dehydrogenase PdxA [Cyanobacterium sp. IPPAS B-1200]